MSSWPGLALAGLNNKRKKVRKYRVASASVCRECPAFGVCTRNASAGRTLEIGPYDVALRRHRDWMATTEAKQAYLRRLPLIEPLFAILKNQLGAQRFTLRGIANVKAEWSLLATAFNLRTLCGCGVSGLRPARPSSKSEQEATPRISHFGTPSSRSGSSHS